MWDGKHRNHEDLPVTSTLYNFFFVMASNDLFIFSLLVDLPLLFEIYWLFVYYLFDFIGKGTDTEALENRLRS